MKVHINYRALCPYTTNAQGEDVYNWYTEDLETDEIQMHGDHILINKGGKAWDSFALEQINTLKITD